MANASIFQQYMRPVKSVAEYGNEMDAAEQNQLQLAAARSGMADDKAMREASVQAGGDQNKLLQILQSGGQYKGAQALQKSMLDSQKTQADVDKTNIEVVGKSLEFFKPYAAQVNSPEAAGRYAAAMYDDPVLGKFARITGSRDEIVRRNMEEYVKNPRAWIVNSIGVSADKIVETMKGTRQNVNTGGTSQGSTVNYYGEVVPGQTTDTPITQSPDSIASNDRIASEGAANRGVQLRGQNLTNARAIESQNGGESAFTPEAISNAAARYNIDGTLPPMGMGKAGAQGRSAILNRAAELVAGVSGDDQRIAQLGNKANSAALSKLQQSQTMVGAFEKNFTRNADIALELSAKVDRTGIPLVNKWINAGKRSITGDPDLSAFDASVKAASNEYAKIISGSMGNTALAEGEIKKVESLLNAAQTTQQVSAVIKLMKRETENRLKGFEEEKAALRGSMSGGNGKTSSPPGAAAKTVNFGDLK